MNASPDVGKLNLEGLMSRAEILFTVGYQFRGALAVADLKASFEAIVSAIGKLHHQLEFRAQNDFSWHAFHDYGDTFHVFSADDIHEKLREISADGFQLRDSSRNFPLQLVVIQSSTDDRFYIAEMCSHEYVDARSAETVFHLIIDHYNARTFNDHEAMASAENTARSLHSLDARVMIDLVKRPDYDEAANVDALTSYPISDDGGHGVRIATLPTLLPQFAQRRRLPVGCVVDARKMIDKCRQVHPEVTKNAIVTAVLHKALYNINVQQKGRPAQQTISGKMVSDILTPGLREQYIGNYIAFVPLSSDGALSIEDQAKAVHDRIVDFRVRQINLTCFDLVEQAAEENAVGTADDELSYVITNWNNYRFLSSRSFLAGCESLAMHSAVNVDPIDAGGAALINRAIVVINLSFDDELCFSMFPSLRDDSENVRLVAEVERLFQEA